MEDAQGKSDPCHLSAQKDQHKSGRMSTTADAGQILPFVRFAHSLSSGL
jgi:hypothetical protein